MQSERIVKLDTTKTYTIVVKKINGSNSKNVSVSLQKNVNTVAEAVTISPSSTDNYKSFTESDGLYRGWIYIPAETICNELELEIMVLEGNYNLGNAPIFEKYGQSPSIEYPSPLEYVEGNQELIHTNKNLFGLGEHIEGFTQINTGTFHVSTLGKSYLFETSKLPNIVTVSAVNANRSNISYYDEIPKENTISKEYSKENSEIIPRTVEINKKYKYILIQLSYQQEISDIQIEEGTSKTDYIESKINKYQLTNLLPMYSEEEKIIYLESGTEGEGYYQYCEWCYKKIDSTMNIFKNDYGTNSYLVTISDISNLNTSKINVLSNICTGVPYNDRTSEKTNIIYANSTNKTVAFRNTEFETLVAFKQFLNENDVYILYRLSIPFYIKKIDSILIKQLDKLRKIITHKGTNHFIMTSENGQNVNLKVTAYKDTFKIIKEEIDNLKALILES